MPETILYVDYYEVYGGGQKALLDTVKGLDRKRYTPALCVNMEGQLAQQCRELGLDVLVADTGRGRWRYFWKAIPAFFRMLLFAADRGAVLVHSNGLKAAKFGGAIAALLNIPALWHKRIHVEKRPNSSTARLWRFYSRFQDKMLAVSPAVQRDLVGMGIDENKVHLLSDFVDTQPLLNAKKLGAAKLKSIGLDSGYPLVAMAAARRHHKGQDLFLEAAALLAQDKTGFWKRCHFVMLGDAVGGEEAYEAALKKQEAAFPQPQRLHLLPWSKDLNAWLKTLSLVVVPSRREGFGLVCVEAMAAGCPVVAAYPEAQYQLIGNLKSLISIPGDAKALAAAMRSAMKDPVRIKKQAALAKKTADKFFSPKIYFTELNRLYQDLIHA